MANKPYFFLTALLSLSSCNFYGGIDKPSGDEQILSAARGCLDRGEYTCATEYYNQLSSSFNDTRLSELSFVSMAQNGVFSVSDLVTSLGSNRGTGASLTTIANLIAGRGKTAASIRTDLDTLYVSAGSITNTNLRYYTRFMISLAMLNQILANAAGADQRLTASDIATNPASCVASGTGCTQPAGNPMADNGGPTTWPGNTADPTWANAPTVDMLVTAATAAESNFSLLTGGSSSYQGIINALNAVKNLPGGAALRRQGLLGILF